jgi:hypothetical protein
LKRRLDFDGATSCVEDAREFGEHAIDGCVRDPTSMPGDQLVDRARCADNVAIVASSSPCIRRL